MIAVLAWGVAAAGLILGGAAAFVPGFPGAMVALIGLTAFAALTDFDLLTPQALVVAAGVSLLGQLGQVAAPIWGSRALRGSAAAASGAALGVGLGAMAPVPGLSLALGALFAVIAAVVWRPWNLGENLRGALGAAGGCLVAVAVDGVAVVAQGGILALSVWLK
ncbi:MAG: DUF456 family protein [Deltaproteobacteria bacterium]|nr:DUF456 family protein [Deltaproteobacteria bacterium]